MIFFLILGGILGALSVIFILQNVAVVTVTFFTYQLTGSLAVILFATVMTSVVMTLLMLLPTLIGDHFRFSALKKQKNVLEDELAIYKKIQSTLPIATPPAHVSTL